jgi:hypothetical protein
MTPPTRKLLAPDLAELLLERARFIRDPATGVGALVDVKSRVRRHLTREINAPTASNGLPVRNSDTGARTRMPGIAHDEAHGTVVWACDEPRCGHTGTEPTDLGAHNAYRYHVANEHPTVKLTTVEAAALAGTAPTNDRRAKAVQRLSDHIIALDVHARGIRNELALLARLDIAEPPAETPQCWAMARIGKDEDVFARRVIAGTGYSLGRWAYDWVGRHGRLPTEDECRAHAEGRKVRVAVEKSGASL